MDIRVKQRDGTDCGAACLVSVARHYNLNPAIAQIRHYAGTDKEGTTVFGMIQAAGKLGFDAKGVKGSFDALFSIHLPAIAHISVNGTVHHYVVISNISAEEIVVMDPGYGKLYKKSHSEFKSEWTGVLIILSPSDGFKSVVTKKSRVDRFWDLIKPYRSVLLKALIGAFLYTLLGLSMSIFIQKIVDDVIVDNNHTLLNLMSIAMLLLVLLRSIVGWFKNVFILRTGQLIDSRLILGYYKHLLKLPQQFFDTMRVGEIISRINDAVKIRLFINDMSINLAVSFFMLLTSLGLMFTFYWKLALLMVLIVPLYSLIYVITDALNKKSQRKLMEDSAEFESQLMESLSGIRTIKRSCLEQYSSEKTEARFNSLLNSIHKSGTNSLFSSTSTEFISQVFTILLLWLGSGYVLSKQVTAGELLSFFTLVGYFTIPVSTFVGMNKVVQDAFIASDRLFEIMDLEREADTNENQIDLTPLNIGTIRFSGISFGYGVREEIFSNFDMEIPLRKMTAIVGESGCGKSTLAALLQNMYPLSGGDILIGKNSVRRFTNRSLREVIGVVPQVTDLFSGSLLGNITIGQTKIDMSKVLNICRRLGIDDFIENLPQGFKTNVGENGLNLSGGQKQRIAIARALYRDPEILILDEATSALDPIAEQYVHEAVADFVNIGKTVIIIAHRLSTIQNAHKIIVLKEGSVKEQGTHAELMARRSEYYSLWTRHLPAELINQYYETSGTDSTN